MPKRLLLLGGVALVLAIILIARWIGSWGMVTIHVKDAPIGNVITSIARQGHVRVEGSLDPSKPVSMDVDQVTPSEAIDLLSIRANASWCVIYLAAPSTKALNEALRALKDTGQIQDWSSFYYPSPPLSNPLGSAIDPATLEWKPEGRGLTLSELFDEAAQKSGMMISLPKDWNPGVQKLPSAGMTGKMLAALTKSARGTGIRFFFLEESRWREAVTSEPPGAGVERDGNPPPSSWMGMETGSQNSARSPIKQEWLEQRQLAQIKRLPPGERARATKEAAEMQAFADQVNDLPPEERRAKMRELLAANPELADKMGDRRLLRDAKMTPEQRIQRSLRYLNGKASAKASSQGANP